MIDKKLYVVRHLKTDDNLLENFGSGDKESQILLGQTMDLEIVDFLKSNLQQGYLIIHTDLNRTRQTSQILADSLSYNGYLLGISELKERFGGKYAGRQFNEIKKDFPEINYPNELWNAPSAVDGLENINSFLDRLGVGLDLISQLSRGRDVVLVAHAGTIKGLMALKSPEEQRLEILIGPTPGNGKVFRMIV